MTPCARTLLTRYLPCLLAALTAVLVLARALAETTEANDDLMSDNPECTADSDDFPPPAKALARVGSTQLRSCVIPYHLEYSPDGTLLIALGSNLLQAWDARTGELVRQIEIPDCDSCHMASVCFAADARTIVLFDRRTIRWIDVRSGEEQQRLGARFTMSREAVLAPGGNAIAALDTNKNLVVFDLPSRNLRFRKSSIWYCCPSLAFSPDGKVLAALEWGRPSRCVHLLDAKTGEELGVFNETGEESCPEYTLSPDGKTLLVRDGEKYDVRRIPSGDFVLPRWEGCLSQAAFTPDGRVLFAGKHEATAVWMDPATGKELRRLPLGFNACSAGVARLALAPDGKGLAAAHMGYISQCDLATGQRRPASAQIGNHPHRFSPDGKLLWVDRDGYLALVDWQSGQELRRVPRQGYSPFLVLSPDGSRIAGTSAAGMLTVWDAVSGKEACVFEYPIALSALPKYDTASGLPAHLLFAADGEKLYVVEWSGRVRVFGLSGSGRERELSWWDLESIVGSGVLASPDGQRVALVTGAKSPDSSCDILIWDVVRRQEVRRFAQPPSLCVRPVAFSPDGNLLAIGSSECPGGLGMAGSTERFTVWDVRNGKEKLSVRESDTVPELAAFSPDDRMFAIGDETGTVHVWEVATGHERLRLTGHHMKIDRLVFSPDSKLLAASSPSDACLIWDVEGCYDKLPSAWPFTTREAARLWDALDDANAAAAFQAMQDQLARPGPTVALLSNRLPAVSAMDAQAVQRLLLDLDSNTFAIRKKAAAALASNTDAVAPLLRKALANNPSAEVQRQLERILAATDRAETERRRELRAVEVAERLATPAARKLLRAWADGSDGAFLTRQARAAVARLEAR